MSCRLRSYRSDDVVFKPLAIMENQDNYVNLATDQLTLEFSNLKDLIKFIGTSDAIKQIIGTFATDPSIVVTMVKNTAIVDDYKLLGNGDEDNILHYCEAATFFFTSMMKPKMVTFTFANMDYNSEFKTGTWYAEDKSFRIGSGATDSYEYFKNECPNRELAKFITSEIAPCRVLW